MFLHLFFCKVYFVEIQLIKKDIWELKKSGSDFESVKKTNQSNYE